MHTTVKKALLLLEKAKNTIDQNKVGYTTGEAFDKAVALLSDIDNALTNVMESDSDFDNYLFGIFSDEEELQDVPDTSDEKFEEWKDNRMHIDTFSDFIDYLG